MSSKKRKSPHEMYTPSGPIDEIQFSPEFIRDRLLRQLQHLCESLRASYTNNRGCNARVSQRELQRRWCQWQTVALTGLFHLPGTSKSIVRCLVIHIAWVGAWPFRQDATHVWRSIHGCNY